MRSRSGVGVHCALLTLVLCSAVLCPLPLCAHFQQRGVFDPWQELMVVGRGGAALAGVRIELRRAVTNNRWSGAIQVPHGEAEWSAKTDESGLARWPTPRRGTWVVIAHTEQGVAVAAFDTGPYAERNPSPVTLTVGAHRECRVLVMDEAGGPMEGVPVYLVNEDLSDGLIVWSGSPVAVQEYVSDRFVSGPHLTEDLGRARIFLSMGAPGGLHHARAVRAGLGIATQKGITTVLQPAPSAEPAEGAFEATVVVPDVARFELLPNPPLLLGEGARFRAELEGQPAPSMFDERSEGLRASEVFLSLAGVTAGRAFFSRVRPGKPMVLWLQKGSPFEWFFRRAGEVWAGDGIVGAGSASATLAGDEQHSYLALRFVDAAGRALPLHTLRLTDEAGMSLFDQVTASIYEPRFYLRVPAGVGGQLRVARREFPWLYALPKGDLPERAWVRLAWDALEAGETGELREVLVPTPPLLAKGRVHPSATRHEPFLLPTFSFKLRRASEDTPLFRHWMRASPSGQLEVRAWPVEEGEAEREQALWALNITREEGNWRKRSPLQWSLPAQEPFVLAMPEAPSAAIAGRIHLPEERIGFAAIGILLRNSEGKVVHEQRLRAPQEAFTLTPLAPGSYDLEVYSEGALLYREEGLSLAEGERLQPNRLNPLIIAQDWSRRRVTLLDPEGKPLPLMSVHWANPPAFAPSAQEGSSTASARASVGRSDLVTDLRGSVTFDATPGSLPSLTIEPSWHLSTDDKEDPLPIAALRIEQPTFPLVLRMHRWPRLVVELRGARFGPDATRGTLALDLRRLSSAEETELRDEASGLRLRATVLPSGARARPVLMLPERDGEATLRFRSSRDCEILPGEYELQLKRRRPPSVVTLGTLRIAWDSGRVVKTFALSDSQKAVLGL